MGPFNRSQNRSREVATSVTVFQASIPLRFKVTDASACDDAGSMYFLRGCPGTMDGTMGVMVRSM